jgi:hypothetical protein
MHDRLTITDCLPRLHVKLSADIIVQRPDRRQVLPSHKIWRRVSTPQAVSPTTHRSHHPFAATTRKRLQSRSRFLPNARNLWPGVHSSSNLRGMAYACSYFAEFHHSSPRRPSRLHLCQRHFLGVPSRQFPVPQLSPLVKRPPTRNHLSSKRTPGSGNFNRLPTQISLSVLSLKNQLSMSPTSAASPSLTAVSSVSPKGFKRCPRWTLSCHSSLVIALDQSSPAATPHDKNINALLWNQAQLNIDPAGGLRTWYPYPSHEPLQALLSAYWERINADATTPTWLDRAINLWVATNRGQSYADLELIQAVSLLELLSWTILVKTTETISNSAFNDKKKNPLSDSIARTLRHMGVSASIPPEIRPLISKLSIDSDSPQSDIGALVIVKLRNSFVHPSDKNLSAIQEIDSNQVHETLSLALHYAELMILWIVGYRGPYLDRLDSSTTRTPPWTSPA